MSRYNLHFISAYFSPFRPRFSTAPNGACGSGNFALGTPIPACNTRRQARCLYSRDKFGICITLKSLDIANMASYIVQRIQRSTAGAGFLPFGDLRTSPVY